MKKSIAETARTHRRIVETAAAEFRRNRIQATTGVNELMEAAGLTHGGFYRHYESKDQLQIQALDRTQPRRLPPANSPPPSVPEAILKLFGPVHIDRPLVRGYEQAGPYLRSASQRGLCDVPPPKR
jgi:AcrR family transcriptional regulator